MWPLMAPFASLIIRTFQFIFSTGTVFFSYNKSAGTVFRLIFSAKRTGPIYTSYTGVQKIVGNLIKSSIENSSDFAKIF